MDTGQQRQRVKSLLGLEVEPGNRRTDPSRRGHPSLPRNLDLLLKLLKILEGGR